jgi:hypothetical protein
MPLIPLIFGFLICTRIDHLCPWVIVESQCKVVNNFAKKSQPKALSVVGDTAQWWSTCQSLGSIPSTGKKKSRELVVKYLGLITNKMKIRFDTSKSLERETLEKG